MAAAAAALEKEAWVPGCGPARLSTRSQSRGEPPPDRSAFSRLDCRLDIWLQHLADHVPPVSDLGIDHEHLADCRTF
jgi:hypothetical protein